MSEKDTNNNDHLVAVALSKIKPNEELGVTYEYNRNKYDNVSKRNKYKKEAFGDKKIIKDTETGKALHINSKAAENKYGKEQAPSHKPNVDHTVPIKHVHSKYRNNPYLTDADINKSVNRKHNYKIKSSHFNSSKGSKTNKEYISTQKKLKLSQSQKIKLKAEGAKAEFLVNTELMAITGKNASKDFGTGSIETAKIAVITSGIKNLVRLANGEIELSEAVADTTATTVKAGALGGTLKVSATILNSAVKNTSDKILLMASKAVPYVGEISTTVVIIGQQALKLVNGEIDGKEFIISTYEDLARVAAGIAGQMLIPIPVVGAMIGTLVCKFQLKVYSYIKDTYGEIKDYKDNADKIENFANAALQEMEQQRLELKSMISEHLKEWDERLDRGFEQIISSAFDNDADGIASGLDVILSAFGQGARFKTASEFDDFFMDENALLEF